VPAIAVIQKGLTLFVIIRCKAWAGGFYNFNKIDLIFNIIIHDKTSVIKLIIELIQ
jgi:hypothetical protein